jgi:hypothetical protein
VVHAALRIFHLRSFREHRLHVLALFPRGALCFPLAMAVLVVMVMEEQSGDDGDG